MKKAIRMLKIGIHNWRCSFSDLPSFQWQFWFFYFLSNHFVVQIWLVITQLTYFRFVTFVTSITSITSSLQMADIPLDENKASILISSQYIMGYMFSAITATRLPRRVLLFLSLVIIGLANIGAGLVLMSKKTMIADVNTNTSLHDIHDGEHMLVPSDLSLNLTLNTPILSQDVTLEDHLISLVPVFSCILICFGYASGLGPVPWILFSELFPASIRGPASSLTAVFRAVSLFLSIKLFPSMLQIFGIGGSFLFCSCVCFTALIVSYFVVPETKGLDSQQLEYIYQERKVGLL